MRYECLTLSQSAWKSMKPKLNRIEESLNFFWKLLLMFSRVESCWDPKKSYRASNCGCGIIFIFI